MSDNLTIGVSVDTAKARADIKLLNAEIANTSKALKDAVKAGDTGGQTAQYQALTGQYQQLAKAQAVVTAAKKADTTATKENTQAHRAHAAGLKESVNELGHLAHAAGLPVEGIRALRAGFVALAGVEIIRAFNAIAARITEIGRLSKETGFDPTLVQQWTVAVQKAGGTAEDAAASLKKLGGTLLEAQGRASFERFLPVGVQGEQDPLKALNIDIRQFKEGAAGAAQLLQAIAQALVTLNRSGKIAEANWRSVQILGKSYRELAEAIELAARGDLSKLQAPVSAEDIVKIEEYNKAVQELSQAWNAFATELVTLVAPAAIQLIHSLEGLLQIAKEVATQLGLIERTDFGGGTNTPQGVGIAGPADTPIPGNAAGGYIRGRGTGTSDSILARLSNGEFVVNAGSVRRLGVGFLHSLNSFAAGGLVGMPPIRFAAGGLASASAGGRPVHLHLGSRSFALSGSSGVVDALVSEANWQQMRSAGTKPSWFAGRPSGR